MSFTLKSIEIKNIRAHEYFLFEPALEGVTAISGDNGVGKSTIVDAFAWSIYGIRPNGVRNKDLIRDGVDPRKKPVSVKSILIIGGIEYAIERKLLTAYGAVECNVWGRKIGSKEFTHVAGPGVSHVEKFIRNELGMNEKGFLTSVLIQQKQVDQIVSASPRERGAVIEELTGIASITQAIQKTNENTRALEKASSIFKVGNIKEAQERVDKQEKYCEELKEKEDLAIKEFQIKRNEHNILNEEFIKESKKVKTRIKLEQEIEGIKKQIDFLKKQAKDDLEYIENFRKKYGTTRFPDRKADKKIVDDKRNEEYELKLKINQKNNELETIEKNISNCNILIKEYDNIAANSLLEEKKNHLINIVQEIDELKNREMSLNSEIRHSKASHEHINGEEKNCPVCKSAIENPEELKLEIENEIKEYENEKAEVKSKITKLKKEEKLVDEEIKEIEIAIEAMKQKKEYVSSQKRVKSKIDKLSKERDKIKIDLKVLETEYDKALRIEADKNALEAAKTRSLTVNNTISENKERMEKLIDEKKRLSALTDKSLEVLENRVKKGQEQIMKMSIAGKESRARRGIELERLADYKKNLKDVKETMKKYNELAKQIDISIAASTMLSAFKADRIESSIPTLEFFASDFLSKFTGGTFTKLTIDEKFNTFVQTADNIIRPVAQLSGGELSSAAIALRLGIAMLLNPSEKNVLILDEVLVSMDEDRARQIMETIGSMTNSQIIFIAHNTDINSIADKTVLVSK